MTFLYGVLKGDISFVDNGLPMAQTNKRLVFKE